MFDNVKTILDYLKRKGVEMSEDARSAAEEHFSGKVLAPSDKVLGEGEVKEAADFHREKSEDLKRLKEENRKLKSENEELEESLMRGDKVNGRKLEAAEAENKELKKIAEKFIKEQRETWQGILELKKDDKLPEALQRYYTFPEEGEKLDDDTVIKNVEKFKEHKAIGALDISGEPTKEEPPPSGGPPRVPPGGHAKDSDAAWRDKNPSEKMRYGYEHPDEGDGNNKGEASMEGVFQKKG